MEKQRDKAARRAQRRLTPAENGDVEAVPAGDAMENRAGGAESMAMPSSLHE